MGIRILTAAAFGFISPALLFMSALILRKLGPLQNEPAHTAQQLVMWYAGRMWTLWVLLLALTFAALVTGCAALKHNWNQVAGQALAVALTITSGMILAIVVLHMLAN